MIPAANKTPRTIKGMYDPITISPYVLLTTNLLRTRILPSTRFDFAVAIAAIDWSALTGLEWYCRFLAAFSAYCREHLSGCSVTVAAISIATGSVLLCFPRLAAWWTALWFVSIAPWLELFLFFSAKGEWCPAIETLEWPVLKTHWMTSSLKTQLELGSSNTYDLTEGCQSPDKFEYEKT
jgi:hypothetical protein